MMSIGSGLTLLISLLFILYDIDSASPDITIFARCLTHRDCTGLVSVAHCCLRQFLTHKQPVTCMHATRAINTYMRTGVSVV